LALLSELRGVKIGKKALDKAENEHVANRGEWDEQDDDEGHYHEHIFADASQQFYLTCSECVAFKDRACEHVEGELDILHGEGWRGMKRDTFELFFRLERGAA